MLELQWPWLLWLLPLPLLMRFLPAQKREEAALRVPFFHAAADLQAQQYGRSYRYPLRYLLLWVIWSGGVLAATNPQWVGEPVSLPSSGRDLMLAVDISESMLQRDMVYQSRRVDRLVAVKLVVGDFVEHRENDRLGLILFGSRAYLQAPLTHDRHTVGTLLYEAQIGFAGPSTAIGDAIGLAVKRLRDQQNDNRVLVLLTDGRNTDGELLPANAADIAAQFNVKIYTIGFGSEDREIDLEALQLIAEKTGGVAFRARDLEQLAEIHNELNRLEPVEQDAQTFRPIRALFYWPLALSFALSLLLAATNLLQNFRSPAAVNREPAP